MDDVAQIIKTVINAVPQVKPYLLRATFKAAGGYDAIRGTYWSQCYDDVEGYLTSTRPTTAFSNSMREAMASAFMDAAYLGYSETSGEDVMDSETSAWLDGRIGQERGFIVSLFERLKEERDTLDPLSEAFARADGFARTLDAIYAEAKMRGSRNITLEFGGDDGDESCPDCQRMKGKKHKIQYILDNGLIPAPGNSNYECKGYKCEHYWFNPKTGEGFKF
jgi:hypothetical protein